MLYLTETLELGQILLFTQISPNCRVSINICKNKTICHKLLERYLFLLCSRYKVLVCFQLKEKTIQLFEIDTQRAEDQRSVINEQKEYMNWKKDFLLAKYTEEKSLRMKEYDEDKIRKDEKHSLEMRVLKLKELKLMHDLGLKENCDIPDI